MHLFCLIILVGADGPSTLPSLMGMWSSSSFITPWQGLCPMRRSTVSSHLSRGRPSPDGVKGLPLLGARSLLHGRIPGLRCTHLKPRTTRGLTRTTPEQEAPGDRSSYYQLRTKSLSLGEYISFSLFH